MISSYKQFSAYLYQRKEDQVKKKRHCDRDIVLFFWSCACQVLIEDSEDDKFILRLSCARYSLSVHVDSINSKSVIIQALAI